MTGARAVHQSQLIMFQSPRMTQIMPHWARWSGCLHSWRH